MNPPKRIMLRRTGSELDGQTGFEATNPVTAAQSQLGPGVRQRQDNLGIEDSDPRWSEREDRGSRRRWRRQPDPEPAIDLGADASDFQGQPTDPFEVLIKRRERGRIQRGRTQDPSSLRIDTGIEPVDHVMGELGRRLYLIEGPLEMAQALLHQVACHVAASHPVLYIAVTGNPRELVLKALARLSGSAAPGDLARARDVADRFRPIRDRLQIATPDAATSPLLIRARLQALLQQFKARGALLAIDDLGKLASGATMTVPAPAWSPDKDTARDAIRRPPPQTTSRRPPSAQDDETMQTWIADLAALARDLDVPVLVVGPGVDGQARLSLPAAVPRTGGLIELNLEGAGIRQTRSQRQGPLIVPLVYTATRSSFDPA